MHIVLTLYGTLFRVQVANALQFGLIEGELILIWQWSKELEYTFLCHFLDRVRIPLWLLVLVDKKSSNAFFELCVNATVHGESEFHLQTFTERH